MKVGRQEGGTLPKAPRGVARAIPSLLMTMATRDHIVSKRETLVPSRCSEALAGGPEGLAWGLRHLLVTSTAVKPTGLGWNAGSATP